MGASASLGLNLNANVDLNEMADQIVSAINSLDSDKYRDKSDTWLFFEGNGATQEIVGSLPRYDAKYDDSRFDINAKDVSWFDNDEARSVLVQNAKAGDTLRVYDSPKASTSDDWTEISIKRDLSYMVIATFEQSYENDLYKISFHRHNGLDGKVSRARNY